MPLDVHKCVVFVGVPTTDKHGKLGMSFRGTAFLVAKPSETISGRHHSYLVTAKHVVDGLQGKPFTIRINSKRKEAVYVVGEGVQKWWFHPTDPSVDVAVLPYSPQTDLDSIPVSTEAFLTDAIARDRRIGTGDDVYMVGLFAHLTGAIKNIPIVRVGNIAMMPDEPVPTANGEVEAYLIEARSIGGLSGSPAFVRETVKDAGEVYLLGLMHGHWDLPPEEKNAANRNKDALGAVNMGIAIVIPAKTILEVIDHPELMAMRS